MSRFYALALIAAFYPTEPLQAQKFVNGDLEANSFGCQAIYNHQFNTFMYDAGYSFGTIMVGGYPGQIYLYENSATSCLEGTAQKGKYFLGLTSYTSGLVDAMSLKLDAPLQANKTYKLTFYYKMSRSVSPVKYAIPLEIGYTTDSLKFGTFVTNVDAPTSTSWVMQSVNIRPTVPTRYITVRAHKATAGGTFPSYTIVDNFSIAVATDVSLEEQAFSVAPHPNPFRESLRFNLNAAAKMPCAITLMDMTGRVVLTRKESNHEVRIPRDGLCAGVYLLGVRDASGATSFSRIVAE